jgi:hypothetical protein
MYRGRARESCKPVSYTLVDPNAQPFSFRPQATSSPYVYSGHAQPAQPPQDDAGEQYAAGQQAGVQGSQSGEETQERNQAPTGACCPRTGYCCLLALATQALSLAQDAGKIFEINIKCACGKQLVLTNQDWWARSAEAKRPTFSFAKGKVRLDVRVSKSRSFLAPMMVEWRQVYLEVMGWFSKTGELMCIPTRRDMTEMFM